jgi:RNA polymerase sigma factor (sigma-70 family)
VVRLLFQGLTPPGCPPIARGNNFRRRRNVVTVEVVRSDSELVRAALAGEREAFGALIGRHERRVTAVARRLAAQEAEDVVQEAFLQAYLGLARLREPERFASWVTAIAVNLARMRLRRRREVPLDSWLEGGRAVPAGLEAADRAEDVAFLDLVRSAVELLPTRERDAVLMYYVDGLTSQEIAELLGELDGTVRVRLHRARRRLHTRLAPHFDGRKEPEMVEVTLDDVVVRVSSETADDAPKLADEHLRIVLLRERDGDRVLPIWVGAPEGNALAVHLGGESMPRPMTADLMARLLEAAGGRVERVVVNSLREKTFYATVTLAAASGATEVDARPSDALNLAARVEAPIFVAPEVIDEAGLSGANLEDELERELERNRGERPAGEWSRLTPELVKALYPPSGGGR